MGAMIAVPCDSRGGAVAASGELQLWGGQASRQVTGVDAEAGRDLGDVVEADVALPAFDLAEERPVDAAERSGLLLAQPELVAAIADSVPEHLCSDRDRGSGHIDNLGSGKSMGLEMIHPN